MPGGIHPPIEQILEWPRPNYIDPDTRPKYVLIFSCIIGPISIALLFARLWARIRIQNSAGWDDWLMLASAFPVLALTILLPLITEAYRFNRHVWDVEPKYFPLQRHYVMAIYSIFSLSSGLIKMSILLFYRRLSSRTVSPAFRWTLRLTIAAIGIYTVAFIFIPIFMCSPISAFWDQVDFERIAKGYKYKCIHEGVDIVAHGIISTIQDLVVAFLPTLLCWNLQMPFRQKLALYGLFAISYTTVAIGAMRTYTGYRIFFQTYDITWVSSDTWLWSLLELHIGSMCANAPALKVFFAHFLEGGGLLSWTRSRSRSRSTGTKKQRSTDTNTSTTSAGPISIFWEKACFLKRYHPRNATGYLSEPHTQTSTDKHGGIVHMNAYLDPSDTQRDSISRPHASENTDAIIQHSGHNSYDRDIELGRVSSRPISHHSEVQALPPVLLPPTRWSFGRCMSPFSRPQRICWDIQSRKYVWKPWERNGPVQEISQNFGNT
ncbi:Nn.00g042260.m01.CDS01 [Neocucurbitaria sp. VM-36]